MTHWICPWANANTLQCFVPEPLLTTVTEPIDAGLPNFEINIRDLDDILIEMLLQDDKIMDIYVVSDPFIDQTPAEVLMETTEEVPIQSQDQEIPMETEDIHDSSSESSEEEEDIEANTGKTISTLLIFQ